MSTPTGVLHPRSTGGLQRGLDPKSAAVVGVSEDPGKYGTRIARSIIESGYPGDLFFVNPRPGSYLGHTFVPSLSDIGRAVDVVIVSVPSIVCADVVEEAGSLGCGCAVVVATGFAEIGRLDLQDDLVHRARSSGIAMIGPNCMGLYVYPARFNAMGDSTIPPGRVAVVAQSGIVGMAMYHAAKIRRLGLSYFISLGNQADVAFDEVMSYLLEDEHTDVALLYVEGFRDLPAFLDLAAGLAARMPVALLRGGRTPAGARAAASHTGSMARDDAVIDAALRRAGVVEVQTPNELLLAAMAFADRTPLRGRSISVVADSGGYATLGADAAVRAGLKVEPHPDRLRSRLREFLLPQASPGNPVDMIGGVDIRPDIFQLTVGACLEEESVDGVAVVGAFAGYGDFGGPVLTALEAQAGEDLPGLRDRAGKAMVVQSVYATKDHDGIHAMRAAGVPVVEHLDEAMAILRLKAETHERAQLPALRWSGRGGGAVERHTLREDQSRRWLAERLPGLLPPWEVVEEQESAVAAVRRLGDGPAVLKVLSDAASHKSDVGGVLLNVRTEEEVRAAWSTVAAICESLGDPARALVTPFVLGSIEAMVGVLRHDELGPVVLIGAGGVFAEAVMDRAFLFPPFELPEVVDAIQQLRIGRALSSLRASPEMRESLQALTLAVGELAASEQSLLELDLNPVLLGSKGAVVLDVRAVVA